MKSTMFLNNTTAIDHAYIDDTGWVVGGSVSPTMFVTGDVDPVEAVVVDFSTVKKEIKHIIDAKYSGFDHKLWIIEDYSVCEVFDHKDGTLTITTPLLNIQAPKDAFKFIKNPFFRSGKLESYRTAVTDQLEEEIMAGLEEDHKGANIHVSLDLEDVFTGNVRMNTDMVPFRYVHGLRNSTSWGCQNVAHGHLSYLAAYSDNPLEASIVLSRIASDLDKSVFAWEKNVTRADSGMYIIDYETGRGKFSMQLKSSRMLKVLKTETTVENLATFVADIYKDELKKAGVRMLFVSEGLNKGAVAEI